MFYIQLRIDTLSKYENNMSYIINGDRFISFDCCYESYESYEHYNDESSSFSYGLGRYCYFVNNVYTLEWKHELNYGDFKITVEHVKYNVSDTTFIKIDPNLIFTENHTFGKFLVTFNIGVNFYKPDTELIVTFFGEETKIAV